MRPVFTLVLGVDALDSAGDVLVEDAMEDAERGHCGVQCGCKVGEYAGVDMHGGSVEGSVEFRMVCVNFRSGFIKPFNVSK